MFENAAKVTEFLYVILMITGVVWMASEGIGAMIGVKKRRVAAVMGPVVGVLANGVGFLPNLTDNWWQWPFAVVMGLVGAFCAALTNDYIIKPILSKFKSKSGS